MVFIGTGNFNLGESGSDIKSCPATYMFISYVRRGLHLYHTCICSALAELEKYSSYK